MPVQQAIPPAVRIRAVTLVKLSDEDASQYIVRDVMPGSAANAWRWSNERPEFKFRLDKKLHYTATMDFTIADVTFKVTGPVTIDYFVNGNSLKKVTYAKSGSYQFEEAVPEGWTGDEFTTFAARIDPVWNSPGDGTHLGVILMKAGFVSK